MRVIVLVKATAESEGDMTPSTELIEAMGQYNRELADAGVMRGGEGLHPSSHGKRVRFDGEIAPSSTGPSPTRTAWWPASGSGRSRTWTRR